MKSIRLLPVVIFAALALLLFKGIGLVTNGGYILTGPVAAVAQDHAAPAEGAAAAPTEPTMTDTAPSMADSAPTMAAKAEASSGDHAAAPGDASASGPEASAAASDAHAAPTDGASASPSSEAAVPKAEVACPEAMAGASAAGASGEAAAAPVAEHAATDCVPMPMTAAGDALPTTRDANGKIVPLSAADGGDSQQALLARLGERRTELDKREAELAMQATLLEAAQKKLDERTKALQDLETKVASLVDQKKAEEDASFKGIVEMYQQMKAKDAARIFDTLDLRVLTRIARAMNPRNVAPILAAMSAAPAQALTVALASPEVAAVTPAAGENLAALPQIVGK